MNDKPKIITIGVAGGTASGKSTISSAIVEQLGAENIVHLLHDSYYKSWYALNEDSQKRREINFDHPASLETALMIEHIQALQNWQAVNIPVYDFVREERSTESLYSEPRPVILVEGILVLSEPDLRKLFDMKIFVDAPPDLRFIRRLQRDIAERGRSVESVIEQYLRTVRPMHEAFVEPSKRYADVIVPDGGHNQVVINMLVDRLRWILHTHHYS